MTFYVENETAVEFPFSVEETVRAVCEAVLESENCPYETQVNVVLTDNSGIREMNRECRGIDRETDVLSFPNVDFEQEGVFDIDEGREADYFDPDTGELMLGDILISVDKVMEQAQNYGHSVRREFAFLAQYAASVRLRSHGRGGSEGDGEKAGRDSCGTGDYKRLVGHWGQ